MVLDGGLKAFAVDSGLPRPLAAGWRTASVSDGEARYGAGGAVTLLSGPADEAEETIVKAQAFLRATNATLEGWQ